MTWVIGASPGAGAYAISVSDIQITVSDGRAFDLVRKAYPVGPHLIGGFAGSVYIGFELLLRSVASYRFLGGPLRTSHGPRPGSQKIGRPSQETCLKRLTSSRGTLTLSSSSVGPDPVEEVGIPGHARPYLCKFSAPDFKPEITPGGRSIISIGRGAQVREYVEAIKDILDPSSRERGHFLRLEDNIYPRGRGIGFHMAITDLLEERPVDGISPHVHTHVATREGCTLMTNKIGMPRVAQSWLEFVQMANGLGIDAAAAVA